MFTTLRQLRIKQKLSQKDVASALNVSPHTISQWERLETPPSLVDAVLLCRLYRCDITTLIKACGIEANYLDYD